MGRTIDLDKIREYMAEELTEKRILHTEGVEETAVHLAERFGEDPEKARVAALCHDLCRKWDEERMDAFLELNMLPEKYQGNINLAHGKAAAIVSKVAFDVRDEDVLHAIAYHTTGREGMSQLEKIIYVADAIEPSRDYDGVEELRQLAEEDLDQACLACLKHTRDHVLSRGIDLDEDTEAAIAWFQTQVADTTGK